MAQIECTCPRCNGTGRCPSCKGTGRYGFPGFGREAAYPDHCTPCRNSGVCSACHGSGTK